jgi:circadian clock protein KaiB
MSTKATSARRRKTEGRARPRTPTSVSKRESDEAKRHLEQALRAQRSEGYVLRLYITGTTPASTRAVGQVRSICEERLHGRYELQVIDIYQMPALAKDHQIIATPTLIKVLPAPLRRFIGDLSNAEWILFGLDLREKK